MAEKICFCHAFKKCFNFFCRKTCPGLNCGPTGHAGEDAVESVFSGHSAVFIAELFEHVEEEFTGSTLAGKGWNG